VKRVTESGEIAEANSIHVDVAVIQTGVQQLAGRRYGILLHAVLQTGGAAALHARRLGATPEEVSTADATAKVLLAHPLLMAKGQVFRELPVLVRLNDGSLLEGRIDLAWTDGNEWVVVDYKSNPGERAKYRRQLQMYGFALQRATGKPARGILVEIGM
jgi:ATP-dependent exoDNAse (exonuclease V) beta subunit